MAQTKRGSVGKGAAYIYIETISSMILGYIFWIFLSKIATPDAIGESSSMVSLAIIMTTIATLGIPMGIQRFLGKSFSENDIRNSISMIRAGIVLVSVATITIAIAMLIMKNWINEFFGFDPDLIVIGILLTSAMAVCNLLRSIIVSSLMTKMLPVRVTVGSVAKIILAWALVSMGFGAIGISIGYLSFFLIASFLLAFGIFDILKNNHVIGIKEGLNSLSFYGKLLKASLPNWIPALITTVGSQLGTIVVFGTHGAEQAGAYFIAFSIFSAISVVMYSLSSAAYPALSGMREGRKKFTTQIIKMSLVTSLPISSALIFYSDDIMLLIGETYVQASLSLEILMLSMLPVSVLTTINAFVYAHGYYRQVLTLGLSLSVPRTLLYFILVPLYGNSGAAVSFTIGSIIGLVVSTIIARRTDLPVIWKDMIITFTIPTVIAWVLSYMEMPYPIGIIFTLIGSYIAYFKLGVMTKKEMHDATKVLPPRLSVPTIKIAKLINKKLTK